MAELSRLISDEMAGKLKTLTEIFRIKYQKSKVINYRVLPQEREEQLGVVCCYIHDLGQ